VGDVKTEKPPEGFFISVLAYQEYWNFCNCE
jgi:hypothetical protein